MKSVKPTANVGDEGANIDIEELIPTQRGFS